MAKTNTTEKAAATAPRNIHERMHAVMQSIDFIAKDKFNDFHKYPYTSEKAIKEAVHEQLVNHGILFNLNFVDLIRTDNSNLLFLVFEYTFTNVENPADFIKGQFIGSGEDKGDKAVYKAITGAIKYLLTSSFLIPTGDDPEADGSDKRPQAAARQQAPAPKATAPTAKRATAMQPNVVAQQTDKRPSLDAKACEQYCNRISNGDTELLEKVIEYYRVTPEQANALAAAMHPTRTESVPQSN